jgi:uncharacterized repeat protein (TIGR01451 family)
MLKRYTFLTILACLACLPWQAFGQSTYTATQIGYNPDPFAAGVQVAPAIDDIYGPVQALPFPFCFYGTYYDSLVVGTNGVVTFDLANANQFCPFGVGSVLPSSMYANLGIFSPVHDLNPAVFGTITMGTYGFPPFRRVVISFDSVPMFGCNTAVFSQQVILFETTNLVEIHMENKPVCTGTNMGASLLGIQKDSTDYIDVPGHTFPTVWSAVNESWRFTPIAPPCLTEYPRDTISGKVFMDLNANCIMDGGDFAVANSAVVANGGQYYDWVDANGDYQMLVDSGTWNVTHFMPGPVSTVCPVSGSYNVYFNGVGLHSLNNDFADTVSMYCPDLTVDIGAINMTACRWEVATLQWCNNGWAPDTNVTIIVTLNDSIALNAATIPFTSLGGNQYAFNLGTLLPFQCATAYLNVSVGCDSVGTVYCMNASISGASADCDTSNNHAQDCHALTASFDPNDKRVAGENFAQQGYVTSDLINADTRLTYMIRFQNTGNDTAFTVTLRDIIDPRLDPATIEMGASSDPYRWFVSNDLLLVEFHDIMLPDSGTDAQGSIGWVRFSARQRPGNQPGDVIHNQCNIYFDHNAPITTNQTENIIRTPSVGVYHPLKQAVSVYPNPGQDRLHLEWIADAPADFELVNVVGQVVARQSVSTRNVEISTEQLQPGIYFWRMQRDGQTLASGKWVRR